MEKIDKRILRYEIAFSKIHSAREFALTDIAADRMDVLMQELGYLAGCVEVEIEAHLIPSVSFISSISFLCLIISE